MPTLRLLVIVFFTAAAVAQKAPFDAETLWKLSRVSDPQVSPDGKLVAFSVAIPDAAKNKKSSHVYVVSISGGLPKEIGNAGASNERPRWSPDSKRISFT